MKTLESLAHKGVDNKALLELYENNVELFSIYNSKTLTNEEFAQWFTGFVNGEGCFIIKKTAQKYNYQFSFLINLHRNDLKVLVFICSMLGFGKVVLDSNRESCTFMVNRQTDVLKLIEMFTNNPLLTQKNLDFLDWKASYFLYVNNKDKASVYEAIEDIRSGMNSKRSRSINLQLANNVIITKYWLLGLIEGEGCFSVKQSQLSFIFRLGQLNKDRILLERILDFIKEVARKEYNFEFEHLEESDLPMKIYVEGGSDNITSPNSFATIYIQQINLLKQVIIPFLASLKWQTKKLLDFKDWASLILIKLQGKHLIPENEVLINRVITQMNESRLSLFSKARSNNDYTTFFNEREELLNLINALLLKESNLGWSVDGKKINLHTGEVINDVSGVKVALVSMEDNQIFKEFKSGYELAKFLGIGKTSVYSKIKTKRPVILNNKKYFIVKS